MDESVLSFRELIEWAWPVAAIVIGGRVLWQSVALWRMSIASASWPAVSAKIVGSTVKKNRGNRPRTYEPEIRYRYKLEDETYESAQLQPITVGVSLKFLAKVFSKGNPVGKVVKAFVNPENPKQAVLYPGPQHFLGALMASVSTALILFGIYRLMVVAEIL